LSIILNVVAIAGFTILGIGLAIYEIGCSLDRIDFDSRVKFLMLCLACDVVIYFCALWYDGLSPMLQALYLSKYMYLSVIDFKKTLAED
jgi:hypothetical protein